MSGAGGLRVAHVITGLELGGAEAALARLLRAADRSAFEMRVVSLTGPGVHGPALAEAGVEVTALGLRHPLAAAAGVARLARLLGSSGVEVVQTWLYHADLLGGLAARAAGIRAVVWGLRSSDLLTGAFRFRTRAVVRLNARLSRRVPAAIVCNSEAARRFHAGLGYAADRMVVIPNGFEVPPAGPAARLEVRRELGIDPSAVVVGRVARFHPHKDHRTFLAAAAAVRRVAPETVFVLCGDGVEQGNRELVALVEEAGLAAAVRLLGPRADVARVTAAFDVACSSSAGEGFPNVVGEAMALAVPAVVTDVGDSAALVAGTGRVVPPGRPDQLAAALLDLVRAGPEARRRLGEAARRRIEEQYPAAGMAAAYGRLYEDVAGRVRH